MNYENFKTGFNKTAIFSAQTYGTKTTVEIDHSDLSLDEVMDAFQTLLDGMGYHHDGFKQWVLERAEEYQEEENEKWNDAIASMGQDEQRYENLRHSTDDVSEWDSTLNDGLEDESNKRMDIIGQNGNEGLHYRATDEDEAEFDDYGARIVTDSSFEWNAEPENDNLFKGDEWKLSQKLIEANKRYKSEVKKINTKKKKDKK